MNSMNIRIVAMVILLMTGFVNNELTCQVTFAQKQSIVINENTGSLLNLRNNNSAAFSETSFLNNVGSGFSIGIAGSKNAYFDSLSTPYIFNSTGNDFHFRSGLYNGFAYYMGDTCVSFVNNYGLQVLAGRPLILRNGHKSNEMVTASNGDLYTVINSNLLNKDTLISIKNSNKLIGVNTTLPKAQLHIKPYGLQNYPQVGNLVGEINGIRISDWNVAENSDNRLAFVYKDLYLAYIDENTGAFVNASDRRLKENVAVLPNILDAIKKLKPVKYNYKGAEQETVGFVAQQVEKIFPELVFKNGDHKALAYDDFSVLAIKAIQELTRKVESLEYQLLHQKNN